jgi:hypothetical protein
MDLSSPGIDVKLKEKKRKERKKRLAHQQLSLNIEHSTM